MTTYLPYIALVLLLWSLIGFWRAVAPRTAPKWCPVWVYGPVIWAFALLWWVVNRERRD